MAIKRSAWLLLPVLAAALGGWFAVRWYGSRAEGVAAQLSRLPQRDAVIVYIDFDRLRRDGLLQVLDSSKIAEDEAYRQFAGAIGLDWRHDLESVMLALAPSGKFMLVRGRFDWKRLRDYAAANGGACQGPMCRVNGSVPERRISFMPLREHVMALAVSTDEWAARTLVAAAPASAPAAELPDAPVWLRIPGAALKSRENMPEGTRMFAHSMEQADFAVLMLAASEGRITARLDVHCNNAADAAEIAGELSHTTTVLRQMIEREHQKPNPADLSGVLTSGSFWSQGTRVYGQWPIERAFLENLFGGA